MARITVEDCIDKVPSRFELVLISSQRARKLFSSEQATVEIDNDKNTVIALREIAEETIPLDLLKDNVVNEYRQHNPFDSDKEDSEFDKLVDQSEQNTKTIDDELNEEIDLANQSVDEQTIEVNEQGQITDEVTESEKETSPEVTSPEVTSPEETSPELEKNAESVPENQE